MLILRASGVRVVVRPSGTEPKLKCYLEVVAGDLPEAAAQLAALRAELTELIGRMSELRGLVGLLVILGVAFLAPITARGSPGGPSRSGSSRRSPSPCWCCAGRSARTRSTSSPGQVEALIHYTDAGIEFLFGPLVADEPEEEETIFALQVLPVIIFIGALVGLLYYLRVIQWIVEIVGGAIAWAMRTTKVESLYAATVIFLGQSEAPLMIQSYLNRLTRSELFVVMTAGFASVAGSTLVGYALLGAPLPFLLAATVMNAPAALYMAKMMFPETEKPAAEGGVRDVRDTESANVDRRDRARRAQRRADRGHRRLPADRLHRADRARQRPAGRRRRVVRLRRAHLPEGARLGLRAGGVAARGAVGRGRARPARSSARRRCSTSSSPTPTSARR